MKRYILLLFSLIPALMAAAQPLIRGRVSDSNNGALAGATVKVQGSKALTISDQDGLFVLATERTAVLEISYVGYKTAIYPLKDAPGTGLVRVVLESDSKALKEAIVSTGYQALPRERATGSFSKIDNSRLNEQVSTGILERLESQANAVIVDRATLGGGNRLVVRGPSTLRGPKGPLIILDNFPYEGDVNNINPNDVESISILKDAAAASIWGARAGNGVIVITTKKARLNQPMKVEFNTNVSLLNKPDLSYVQQTGSSDFIDAERMLFDKGFYTSTIASSSKPVVSPVVELLIKKQNGTLSADAAEGQITALRSLDIRDDFNRYVYETGINQQYALGLSGGTYNHSWNASAGYDKNKSQLGAVNNRMNLRFSDNFKAGKNLLLNGSVYLTQRNTASGKPGYGEIASSSDRYFYPYTRLANDAGDPVAIVKNYRDSYLQTAGGGKLLDWSYVPLEDYRNVSNASLNNELLVNAGLNYTLFKGFAVDVKYQYERQQGNGRLLQNEDSYFARNLVNSYTQINAATGAVTYKVPKGGVLDLSNDVVQSNQIRGQLNFQRKWGKQEVNAIAGGEARDLRNTGNSNRVYGYRDDVLTYGNVDYTATYPLFVSGNTAFIPDRSGLTDRTTRFISAYINAAYTYAGKYTASVSGRRDASNLFGLNTNDKWNPLGSVGAAWLVSEEKFYKAPWLPYLKFRATYGLSGNTDPSMTAVTTISYAGNSAYSLSPYARFSNYFNPELKWETSKQLNLGIDFATKNNRVNGSLEYYRKTGSDLFGSAEIDYTGGIGRTVLKNAAGMIGRGFDAELNSINVDGPLRWETQLNLSLFKDKITNYYLEAQSASGFVTTSVLVSGVVGRPVYSIYSYKSASLDPQTGDPRGYLNGALSKDYTKLIGTDTKLEDLVYHGSALPTTFGSAGNTFSWKNLSLTARISYKLGYYFRRQGLAYSSLYTNADGNAELGRRWQKPGDEAFTDVPSMVYPASTSRDNFYKGTSELVEKGDHVRLQYINLSYTLDKGVLSKLPVRAMNLYANINNVGVLWKANKAGVDPEYNGQNILVPPRSFSFGLRATID